MAYRFKPYYNWNTFNTKNGYFELAKSMGFKPYYNWNTFNTKNEENERGAYLISFKPYYNWNTFNTLIPFRAKVCILKGFKPYYNWNTFNTKIVNHEGETSIIVLNLIITGIPSILDKFWS